MQFPVAPNPFNLRMDSHLKADLEAAAKANGRSLNAEILYRLRRSLETYRNI